MDIYACVLKYGNTYELVYMCVYMCMYTYISVKYMKYCTNSLDGDM